MAYQFAEIKEKYEQVLERIDRAARCVNRDAHDVRLVVVTKAHPVEAVELVVRAGARYLGENYAEEALAKMQAGSFSEDVAWHMIGHIQSRKAKLVCEGFDYVHSLDSVRLAQRLDRFAADSGRRLPVLLEYNTSGEATKVGWAAWQEECWGELEEDIAQILNFNHLEVCGVMTMAPFLPDPELARPYFQRLRRLRDYLAVRFPQNIWKELSMGMSADFEVAIQEGATWVRIGQLILGPRPKSIK